MLEILSDTFGWRQGKIVVVPKVVLVRNFLGELVRWPNKWRDFWATLNTEDAKAAAGGDSWRRLKKAVWDPTVLDNDARKRLRDTLELKHGLTHGRLRRRWIRELRQKHPGIDILGGPLRVLNYTAAGGRSGRIPTLARR